MSSETDKEQLIEKHFPTPGRLIVSITTEQLSAEACFSVLQLRSKLN
jgi:hypothetical protein